MVRLLEKLERSSQASLIVAGLVVLAFIGIIDYLTGFELLLSVFYLLEVGLAAWFVGKGFGLLMSVFSVLVWIGGVFGGGAHPSPPLGSVCATVFFRDFLFYPVFASTHFHSLHPA